jgi:hypothetical protein
MIRIDSRNPEGQRVVSASAADAEGVGFFQALLDELYQREPALRKPVEKP